MKHRARVCRYKHRDHLLFWISFHVPGRARPAPSGWRCCPAEVHSQPMPPRQANNVIVISSLH